MCEPETAGSGEVAAEPRSADIHLIYDPFNPSQQAIISTARRLQEFLIDTGALAVFGSPLPFPALAQVDPAT